MPKFQRSGVLVKIGIASAIVERRIIMDRLAVEASELPKA